MDWKARSLTEIIKKNSSQETKYPGADNWSKQTASVQNIMCTLVGHYGGSRREARLNIAPISLPNFRIVKIIHVDLNRAGMDLSNFAEI